MAFVDNNNTLHESVIPTDTNKEMKFSLLENKKSGLLRASIREFQHSDAYDGPTKNGMMLKINTTEDIEKYQKAFNDFFETLKNFY